jgi:hypothetical protein
MGTTAVIITVAMAVLVLLAVGLNEIRSRNRRSDQRTNVPVVGDILDRKEDRQDEKATPTLNDFSPDEPERGRAG